MEEIPESLERVYALALLETAMERFRRGNRAAARDLLLGVGQVAEGEIERFALDAARRLEADGGFPSDGAMEAAHARLTAGVPVPATRPAREQAVSSAPRF